MASQPLEHQENLEEAATLEVADQKQTTSGHNEDQKELNSSEQADEEVTKKTLIENVGDTSDEAEMASAAEKRELVKEVYKQTLLSGEKPPSPTRPPPRTPVISLIKPLFTSTPASSQSKFYCDLVTTTKGSGETTPPLIRKTRKTLRKISDHTPPKFPLPDFLQVKNLKESGKSSSQIVSIPCTGL